MTTETVALAPRPATEIDPPVLYSLPSRQFMSKEERRSKAVKGESTLPPERPAYTPYTGSPRIWDPELHKMVPLADFKRQVGKDDIEPVPTEYHFTTGMGGCKIYTPCPKRPCYSEDHTDITGKIVRWKGTTRKVTDIPFPDAPDEGEQWIVTHPSTRSPASPPSTEISPPVVSTGTAPRLGPAIDVIPRFQVAADGVCSPVATGLPRLYLRGTKRWLGQVLPSFRPPM